MSQGWPVVVGAGPGDPDLVTLRGRELLLAAEVVVAAPDLHALGRALGISSLALEAPPEVERVAYLVHGTGSDFVAPAPVACLVPGLSPTARMVVPPGSQPLLGLKIVVTRAADQATEFSRQLRRLGASVVALPTIVIAPPADGGRALADALGRIERYAWVVLTSTNGAAAFVEALDDARRLGGVKLAAIGPATAAVLREAHLPPDLVPDRYVAEALLEAFALFVPSGPVLLARAAVARDVLPDGLAALGWQLDVVEAYRTLSVEPPADELAGVATADVVTFTAPSTVKQFARLLAGSGAGAGAPPMVACIGPVTADAARAAGFEPTVVASHYTIDGLLDAVIAWARTSR